MRIDKAVPVKEKVWLKEYYEKVKSEMLFQHVGCIGHDKSTLKMVSCMRFCQG